MQGHEIRSILDVLKKRIGPAASAAEAEQWWPLALTIDSAVCEERCGSSDCREASRCLLWAVSSAIRSLKESEITDLGSVCAALTTLESKIV